MEMAGEILGQLLTTRQKCPMQYRMLETFITRT